MLICHFEPINILNILIDNIFYIHLQKLLFKIITQIYTNIIEIKL